MKGKDLKFGTNGVSHHFTPAGESKDRNSFNITKTFKKAGVET